VIWIAFSILEKWNVFDYFASIVLRQLWLLEVQVFAETDGVFESPAIEVESLPAVLKILLENNDASFDGVFDESIRQNHSIQYHSFDCYYVDVGSDFDENFYFYVSVLNVAKSDLFGFRCLTDGIDYMIYGVRMIRHGMGILPSIDLLDDYYPKHVLLLCLTVKEEGEG